MASIWGGLSIACSFIWPLSLTRLRACSYLVVLPTQFTFQLYAGGLRFRKSSDDYSYSHDKYWIVNGNEVCWSTGNWSPSDYPTNHNEVRERGVQVGGG